MRKMIRNGLLISMASVLVMSMPVEAANTLFDVPSMGMPMDNLAYENTAQTIQITEWVHGTEANIINTGSMEAAIAEVNSNVTPSGGKPVISIYTNGADISGAAINAIAGAGWARMAFYYYDYMVEGDAAAGIGGQSPRCAFVEDETVLAELEQRGYDGACEMVSVEGWYAPNAYVTMYERDSLFGEGKHFDTYKYDARTNSFVRLAEQGFYGENYFSLFYVQGDGIYIATTKPLTEDQMAAREVDRSEESEDETENAAAENADTNTAGEDAGDESASEEAWRDKVSVGEGYVAVIRDMAEKCLQIIRAGQW